MKKQITTERLVLKPIAGTDTDRLVNLLQNKEMTETYMVPDFSGREETERFAKKLISFSAFEDEHFFYGIYLDSVLIGWINVCDEEEAFTEFGYCIDPAYHNRGYATEATRAAIGELFSRGVQTVRAGYFEGNIPSRRVMEKCGMHPIAHTDFTEYRGEHRLCRYLEKNVLDK